MGWSAITAGQGMWCRHVLGDARALLQAVVFPIVRSFWMVLGRRFSPTRPGQARLSSIGRTQARAQRFWFTGMIPLDPFAVYGSISVPEEQFAAVRRKCG